MGDIETFGLWNYVCVRIHEVFGPGSSSHPVTAFKARRCCDRVIKLGENATEWKGVRWEPVTLKGDRNNVLILQILFLQEFGQSTPEIRRSGRKMPSLFRKKKLEKEFSSNTGNEGKTQKTNGIPMGEDPDEQYFDVNIFLRSSLSVGTTVVALTSRLADVQFANV